MSKARPVFSSTGATPKSPPGPRSNRNSTLRSRPLKSPAFAPLWRKKNMTLLRTVLLTSMGALALAACGESKTDPAQEQEVVAKVAPPAGKSWSEVVRLAGAGRVMRHPDAPLKLEAFGDFTT